MTRNKKIIHALLFIAVVTIILLLFELFLRIFYPKIGWAPRKEASLGWVNAEYVDFNPNRPKKGQRILFLGDSFLAGSGLNSLDERFPIQLKRKLGKKVEVQIMAVGGWGTDQQLLAFIQKGRAWKPDLVVLAFCAVNDISNILSNHHGRNSPKPYFVLNEKKELDLYRSDGSPYREIFANRYDRAPFLRSFLWDLLQKKLFGFNNRAPSISDISSSQADPRYLRLNFWDRRHFLEFSLGQSKLSCSPQLGVNDMSAFIHEDFETNTLQWSLLAHILDSLNREVSNIQGKLVVMLLPVIYTVRDPRTIAGSDYRRILETPDGTITFRSAEPRDRLSQICRKLDVLFFDPTRDFIDRVRDDKEFRKIWPDERERHFSTQGHSLLAELSWPMVKALLPIVACDG